MRIDAAFVVVRRCRARCRRRRWRGDTRRRPRPSRSIAARRPSAWARQRCARGRVARLGQRREQRDGAQQQPAEPDAFARARLRRPGSCRRSSRRCRSAAGRARRSARGTGRGRGRSARTATRSRPAAIGWKKASCSPGASGGPSRNGTLSSSTAASPGRRDIGGGGEGQPDAVVGDARAHALAGMRQPPMLHVALDELPRRRRAADGARVSCGRGEAQRHAVLQLVAEAVGAARLIEAGARPDAAGERLIEQPAVEHDVHRAVGRPDLHRAQHVAPMARHLRRAPRRDRPRGSGATRSRAASAEAAWPRNATTSTLSPGAERRPSRCSAAQGSSAGAGRARQRRLAGERRRRREPAAAAEELGAVGGPGGLAAARGRRRRRGRESRCSRGCAPASRRSSASISVAMNGAEAPARRPEHPFGIARDRQPPRPVGEVAQRQARDLDRIAERHVLQQVERDAVAPRARSGCSRSRGGRRSAPPSRIGCAVGVQSSPVSSSRT